MAVPEINNRVYEYCQARSAAEALSREADEARKKADEAVEKMNAIWSDIRCAPQGVYAFKEMGRWAVVIDGSEDAPPLMLIR